MLVGVGVLVGVLVGVGLLVGVGVGVTTSIDHGGQVAVLPDPSSTRLEPTTIPGAAIFGIQSAATIHEPPGKQPTEVCGSITDISFHI